MTKKEMFNKMLTVEGIVNDAEMTAFIQHELELLDRKTSGTRKPTATQVENTNYKALIVDYLTEQGGSQCIKDIQGGIPELAELTNQRITHLLTDLVKSATLKKEYVKKTPFYSLSA